MMGENQLVIFQGKGVIGEAPKIVQPLRMMAWKSMDYEIELEDEQRDIRRLGRGWNGWKVRGR
jgi:hypothetical protein